MIKPEFELQNINALRFLAVDAVQKANSGHPGLPLGAAPLAYVLWTKFLRHNPANPGWFNRDRFILSAGHGSALLYGLLHLTGYDLSLADLQEFRQWESKTPGHPERGVTPGVEITTGPLGQGFANGVGMAIAEAHLAASYNKPDYPVIEHYTYGLVSDGDLMEGVAAEAASLAGHLHLGKLIYLYDDNGITLAGTADLTFSEDVAQRFGGYGWHVEKVADGNSVAAIEAALHKARTETERPSLIMVRTHIGYGSPHKQDSFEAHGSPLGADEVALTKQNLGWPGDKSFYVPADTAEYYWQAVAAGAKAEHTWEQLFSAYAQAFSTEAAELSQLFAGVLPQNWEAGLPIFPSDPSGLATRVASGKTLQALALTIRGLIGGSADLNPSTNTLLTGLGDFQYAESHADGMQGLSGGPWGYMGRNLPFGVREHAMGAIMNGIAAHGGLLPFGATFFVFSDYLRPAIRLAALMKLHVVYVFTHDSIAVGEDGATHQPVEHLASLRAIPGLLVIRPCDANETVEAWRTAVKATGNPVALILTRQKLPVIDRKNYAPADGLQRGGYVLADAANGQADAIMIASGSEVSLALAAREELAAKQNIQVRVVSMPCWELFDAQPQQYRDSVLPPGIGARLAIEAGSAQGWHRYVGLQGGVVGIDGFGASAPGEIVMREYGFTVEHVCGQVTRLLNK